MAGPLTQERAVSQRARRAVARAASDRRIVAGAAATADAALAAGVARELSGRDNGDEGAPSQAFRIKGDESASAAVRRIATDRLDDALEQLRVGTERDTAQAIHEARKDLKKTRAVLRLVRDPLGKERFQQENARLRDAGRALSVSRDAAAKIETVDALAERYGEELPEGLVALRAALTDEHRELADNLSDAGSELRSAAGSASSAIDSTRASIDEWSFAKSGFKLIAPGLERSYGRGRKRFAQVRREPTPENVHEWRKRTKDVWYDLRLLRDVWPAVLEGMVREAHELSDLLGDHHDLTVLAEDARDRSAPELDGDELSAALSLVESRQEELLEAAIPIGERLYAEPPKDFVKRLHAYWRARRGSPKPQAD